MNEHMNGETVTGPKKFVASSGKEVFLTGISPLLIQKLQSMGTLPDVPTRKVRLDLDDGEDVFQEEELSEKDLQDDEERKRWAEYVKQRDAVLEKRNDGFIKAIFTRGVEVDLSNLDEWRMEQEFFGLEVPDHPLDQKVSYIQTEVVSNADDLVEIITGVLGQSGIPEEELASVRAMFRGAVRPRTSGETDSAEREVAVEPELHGDESSALLESVAAE